MRASLSTGTGAGAQKSSPGCESVSASVWDGTGAGKRARLDRGGKRRE